MSDFDKKIKEMTTKTEILPGGLVKQSSEPTGRECTEAEMEQSMIDAGYIPLSTLKQVIEGMDKFYVLNGSITKHKGGHLIDVSDLLTAITNLN